MLLWCLHVALLLRECCRLEVAEQISELLDAAL
jgi:hypothetical protein